MSSLDDAEPLYCTMVMQRSMPEAISSLPLICVNLSPLSPAMVLKSGVGSLKFTNE